MVAQQIWRSWLPVQFLVQLLIARRCRAFIYVRRPRLRAAVSTACVGITQRVQRCARFSGNARSHRANVVAASLCRGALAVFARRRGYNGNRIDSFFTIAHDQSCLLMPKRPGRGGHRDLVACLTLFGRFTSSHSTPTNVKASWHDLKCMRHFVFSVLTHGSAMSRSVGT